MRNQRGGCFSSLRCADKRFQVTIGQWVEKGERWVYFIFINPFIINDWSPAAEIAGLQIKKRQTHFE